MEPKIDEDISNNDNQETNEDQAKALINHPILNKWLTAEIINNLPDETAQAVADLIEAAVRRKKPAVNAHTYSECYGGTGKTSWEALEQIRELLSNRKGVKDVSEKQPEQQGD